MERIQEGSDHVMRKYKVTFLGDTPVGKTSIISQFVYQSFSSDFVSTIGIDFLTTNVCLGNQTVRLQIWDTAGQERFRSLLPSYIRDSSIVLLVYDVTDRDSFLSVDSWANQISNEFKHRRPVVILVGNKTDLANRREVSSQEGLNKANELGLIFIETSAKTGDNINYLFRLAAEECTESYLGKTTVIEKTIFEDNLPKKAKKSKCYS